MDWPNFWRDSPETCVAKVFNGINKIRNDILIMRGRSEVYLIDKDFVRCARALADEVEQLYNRQNKKGE